MGTTSNTKTTKLCIVVSGGTLPILGGISGPILSPSKITISDIVTLLNAGKEVYEVNPWNRSQKVKLTTMNALDENFTRKSSTNIISNNTNYVQPKPSSSSASVKTTIVTKDNSKINTKKSGTKKKIVTSDFSA